MLSLGSLTNSAKNRLLMGLLFVAGFTSLGQAQEVKPKVAEEDQQSALSAYGEHHPIIFIIAIFVVVIVAVWLVYYFFKKAERKNEAKKEAFTRANANVQKTRSHPADRRSAARRGNLPQTGGFTRK